MRANYKLQRLFLDSPLNEGMSVSLDKAKSNYLLNVLRLQSGSELLVFNGRDGEWRARLKRDGKIAAQLVCQTLERPQTPPSTLLMCFAPLKAGRLDYMIQKSVEMGAGVLQPVLTDFTQNHRLNMDKIRAWAVEAAEQCGVLALPNCSDPVKLSALLDNWEEDRALIFCDEDHETNNPLARLETLNAEKIGVLIGPEGGFSDEERANLRAKSYVQSIPLGPRILRADTAAVAALAIVQAKLGDWR